MLCVSDTCYLAGYRNVDVIYRYVDRVYPQAALNLAYARVLFSALLECFCTPNGLGYCCGFVFYFSGGHSC